MNVPEITVQELARRQERGEPVHLLDVREPWERALAALPGGELVPLGSLGARVGELEVPEAALVVVYCHHGMRSLSGAAILREAGIDAVSLRGGIDAWSAHIDSLVPRY